MNDSLTHRGPDEAGIHLEGPVGLGHRRLSIIDLKGGQQPIYNEDGTKVIVFNGEIYNYRAIRDELMAKGHVFKTASDTETILHLYEEMGTACVERLRGMFAFAIWDKSERSLFLARDRVGKKPLYYCLDDDRLLFGSELKAILGYGGVSRDLDTEALSDYLTFLYIPSPKTIFKAVRKLPAAHWLLLKDGRATVRRYWDLSFAEVEDRPEEEWAEALLEAVKRATEMRLVSEVPLGAFLSGGVDSSLVVALMASLSREPVKTNTIGFAEAGFDESAQARETARHFRAEHHEHRVTTDCAGILDTLAWHYDEPFADSSALPTYYVSKMTRANVTVALSGDGGDESFAGYRRYYFDALENRLRGRIPGALRSTLVAGMAAAYPKADWLPRPLRAKTLLTNLSRGPAEGYFHTMSHFHPDMQAKVLHGDVRAALRGYSSFEVFRAHYERCDARDALSRAQYADIMTSLADGILTKVDRASMAVSLEVRCPILDHEVMEMAARIPPGLKLRGRSGKHILKAAARRVLPASLLERPKMGFSIPIEKWFRGELRPLVEEELLGSGSRSARYFDLGHVRKMWREHQRGQRLYGYQFWALLMFEKWARHYL